MIDQSEAQSLVFIIDDDRIIARGTQETFPIGGSAVRGVCVSA